MVCPKRDSIRFRKLQLYHSLTDNSHRDIILSELLLCCCYFESLKVYQEAEIILFGPKVMDQIQTLVLL